MITIRKPAAYKLVKLSKSTTCLKCGWLIPARSKAMRGNASVFCAPCYKILTKGIDE